MGPAVASGAVLFIATPSHVNGLHFPLVDKLQLSNYIESGNALNKPCVMSAPPPAPHLQSVSPPLSHPSAPPSVLSRATLQTQLLLDKTEFHRFTVRCATSASSLGRGCVRASDLIVSPLPRRLQRQAKLPFA